MATAEDLLVLTGIGLAVKGAKALRALVRFAKVAKGAARPAVSSVIALRARQAARASRIGMRQVTGISGVAAVNLGEGAVENASFGEAYGLLDIVTDFIPVVNAGKAWWRVGGTCF